MPARDPLPAIRRIDTHRGNLCALDIVGHFTAADLENAYGLLEAAYSEHDTVDLLVKDAQLPGFRLGRGIRRAHNSRQGPRLAPSSTLRAGRRAGLAETGAGRVRPADLGSRRGIRSCATRRAPGPGSRPRKSRPATPEAPPAAGRSADRCSIAADVPAPSDALDCLAGSDRLVGGRDGDEDGWRLPLRRGQVRDCRRVRKLLPLPLLAVPQANRLGACGQSVLVHRNDHLARGTRLHSDLPASGDPACEVFLCRMRRGASARPLGSRLAGCARRLPRQRRRDAA